MTLAREIDLYAPWIEHLLHRKVPEDLFRLKRYSQVAQRVAWVKDQLNNGDESGGG